MLKKIDFSLQVAIGTITIYFRILKDEIIGM